MADPHIHAFCRELLYPVKVVAQLIWVVAKNYDIVHLPCPAPVAKVVMNVAIDDAAVHVCE